MFRKNHKNVNPDVQIKEDGFSKLPTAKEAYAEFTKVKQSKADNYPVLTTSEIISEIKKKIAEGSTFVIFFNQKITDEDKKVLKSLGYEVEVNISQHSSHMCIRISWDK